MDELVVHEAYFGEQDRAHTVLSATCDSSLADRIAPELDLPGQIPPSVKLKGYVSGFPSEDWYVVARTSLDERATRRGMVFSHAFFLRLGDIKLLSSLEQVFSRLHRERTSELTAIEQTIQIGAKPTNPGKQYPNLVAALLRDDSKPVVVSDNHDFEQMISTVWANLIGDIRSRFSFRISFGPDDVEVNCPTIVSSPVSVLTRWNPELVIRDPDDVVTVSGPAVSLLCGASEPKFLEFMEQMEVVVENFAILSRLDKAFTRMHGAGTSFDKLISAARLVGALQPDPTKGTNPKELVVERAADFANSLNADEVLLLRNFDTRPCPKWNGLIGLVFEWAQAVVVRGEAKQEEIDVFGDASLAGKATEEWQDHILRGFEAGCNVDRTAAAELYWKIMISFPDSTVMVLSYCPDGHEFDRALADAFVRLSVDLRDESICSEYKKKGYSETGAEILASSIGVELALERICSRNGSKDNATEDSIRAIDRLIGKVALPEAVSLQRRIHDPRVFEHAVTSVASNPSLVNEIDWQYSEDQALFSAVAEKLSDSREARKVIKLKLYEGLDCLLDGVPIDESSLAGVSGLPQYDLLDYPRRAEVWSQLPSTTKASFLSVTASAWMDLDENRMKAQPLERELRLELISTPRKSKLLDRLVNSGFVLIVWVFSSVHELTERDFESVLRRKLNDSQSIDHVDAQAVGQLLANKRWRRVARDLASRYATLNEWHPLFRMCRSLLRYSVMLPMGFHEPTNTELREMLLETLIELYPKGPNENNIWERAGGEVARLDLSGSGEEQWQRAIQTIKRGGSVSISHMLDKMEDDFPRNNSLVFLRNKRIR